MEPIGKMSDHTEDQLFSCDVCGKSCTSKVNLSRIMFSHTGMAHIHVELVGSHLNGQAIFQGIYLSIPTKNTLVVTLVENHLDRKAV